MTKSPFIFGPHAYIGSYTFMMKDHPLYAEGKPVHLYQAIEPCFAQPVGRPPLFIAEQGRENIPVAAYIGVDEYGYMGYVPYDKAHPVLMDVL